MAGRGLSFLWKRARQLANIANNQNQLQHQHQHQRAFGAAAALAYDYDYDFDDYYYSYDLKKPMLDGEGSEPRRGLQWVIIGQPGSSKHLYANWLSKLLHVPHISLSTLLTHQLTPTSYLYNQIENAVNQGKLVPEDIVFGLLSKKLEEGYSRGETGFILDGIPRTRMQAEVLDQIADIDLVLNFKCAEKHLQQNEAGNGLSLQSHGSWVRSFPEEAVWKEKLRTYSEQSKPLEDYYRKQKKLLDFEVGGAPGETWQGLLSVLQLQHMNSSFQKLTA